MADVKSGDQNVCKTYMYVNVTSLMYIFHGDRYETDNDNSNRDVRKQQTRVHTFCRLRGRSVMKRGLKRESF